MPEQNLPPTIFHMLEKSLGKKIRVILDSSYGFEAVILRATIAQPIPQVASREERSEIFVHLNSAQRIEILHTSSRR
jgi:hypothetical protein